MLRQNVSLKDFSNYKIGGPAAYFLEAKTKEELVEGLKEWRVVSKDLRAEQKKVFVLGGGTNILFSDQGFPGLVIKIFLDAISFSGQTLSVGAGTLISALTDFCIAHALSGFEWAGGMPGTVGGAIRGNAGAFGGETNDNLLRVESLNLDNFGINQKSREECDFSYRSSIFKTKALNEVIISADFVLKKGDREEIAKQIREKIEFRQTKHPLDNPNAGSVFKNVPLENVPAEYRDELLQYVKKDPIPVVPAGKLIFLAGLKGRKVGGAAVSDKHTNFIVNLGNATADNVKDLIAIVKNEVKQKYGLELEEEIMEVN